MCRYIPLFILSLVITSYTLADGWVVLGEKVVDHRIDTDVVKVGKHEGLFSKIRFHVQNKPIHLYDLKVHFENGKTYDVAIQRNFAEGQYSKVIDLPGNNRRIDYVTFKYHSTRERGDRYGNKGFRKFSKAKVKLLGLNHFSKNNHHSLDWVKLGSRYVNSLNDTDIINVGRRDGAFRALRLQVTDSNIYMNNFTVDFSRGRNLSVEVNRYMRSGQYTTILDLPGSDRYIKQVRLTYSSSGNYGRAQVHVWALQNNTTYNDNKDYRNRKTRKSRFRKDRKRDQVHKGHHKYRDRRNDKDYRDGKNYRNRRDNRDKYYRLVRKWELLGRETANFSPDKDLLRVRGKKKYARQIQLRIENEDVNIWDLKVFFENGSHADIAVRRPIPAGSVTRIIDLPGELRKINSVQLIHKTQEDRRKFRQRKAVVEVWAK